MSKNSTLSEDSFYKIELIDPKRIKFPKVCIYCGKRTDRFHLKKFYGIFTQEKDFKTNYELKIPLCLDCQINSKIKNGYKNFRLWLTFLLTGLGITGAIFLILINYAWVLGIGLTFFSFIIPFFLYRKNVKKQISLDDVYKIEFSSKKSDFIWISMKNKSYINYLNQINNSKKEEEKEIETEQELE